jgi:hypothetical protein
VADARRAIESSADFTRGGTPPVPDHDATERQRAERIAAEQCRLIAWAKAHGKLGGRIPKDDVGGGEHIRLIRSSNASSLTLRIFYERTRTESTTAKSVAPKCGQPIDWVIISGKRTMLILLKNPSGQKMAVKSTIKSVQPLDKNVL